MSSPENNIEDLRPSEATKYFQLLTSYAVDGVTFSGYRVEKSSLQLDNLQLDRIGPDDTGSLCMGKSDGIVDITEITVDQAIKVNDRPARNIRHWRIAGNVITYQTAEVPPKPDAGCVERTAADEEIDELMSILRGLESSVEILPLNKLDF